MCLLLGTQAKAGVQNQAQPWSLGVGVLSVFKIGSNIEVTIYKDIAKEVHLGTSLKAWGKGTLNKSVMLVHANICFSIIKGSYILCFSNHPF